MSIAIFAGVAWLIGGLVGQALLWVLAFMFFAVFIDDVRPEAKYLGVSIGFTVLGSAWAVCWIWQVIVSIIHIVTLCIAGVGA